MSEIKKFARLGREIKISPKTNISINRPGRKVEYMVETVEVTIGIGPDHSARLLMDVDSWVALKNGEEINITTTKEFERI